MPLEQGPAYGHTPRIYYVYDLGHRVAYCRVCTGLVGDCDVCGRPACESSLMHVMEPEGACVGPCCADRYDADGYRKRRAR